MKCKETLQNCKLKSGKIGKTQNTATIHAPQHDVTLLYIYYIIFYIIYYRVTDFRPLFATFRSICCYSVLLPINCYANVTPLYGHGEVMCRSLTNVTTLFLALFKCKQIKTL